MKPAGYGAGQAPAYVAAAARQVNSFPPNGNNPFENIAKARNNPFQKSDFFVPVNEATDGIFGFDAIF